MAHFETHYDANTLLSGDVETYIDSFDHAFGRQRIKECVLNDFEIRIWIGNYDVEISGLLRTSTPALYSRLKDHFMEAYFSRDFD